MVIAANQKGIIPPMMRKAKVRGCDEQREEQGEERSDERRGASEASAERGVSYIGGRYAAVTSLLVRSHLEHVDSSGEGGLSSSDGKGLGTGDEGAEEGEGDEGGGSDGESLSDGGGGVSSGVEGIGLR